jgi:c-di-GMP-binding flagellar brake protein YcgR
MPEFIDLRPGLMLNVMPGYSMLSVSYQAVIRHVSDDGIRVDRPRLGESRLELSPGADVTLILQFHGRMYTCTSRVLEVQDAPVESLLLEHPTEVKHNERRQFYRLLTSITPRYAACTNKDGDELERLDDVRIIDISGGGVQMRVKEWVPVGSRVRLVFALEQDPLEIDVNVLALAVQQPDVRRSYYRINSKFIEIERDVQERIIRFIFRQQMLLRQQNVI